MMSQSKAIEPRVIFKMMSTSDPIKDLEFVEDLEDIEDLEDVEENEDVEDLQDMKR